MPIDIANATKTQLIEYAKAELGVELASNMKIDDIRAAVREASGEPEVTPVKVAPMKAKTYTINIAKTNDDTGSDDVFVGVNGKGYLLKRGVDIPNVPASVVDVLRNAVETRYSQKRVQGSNAVEMVKREVQSYPFSIVA